MGFFVVYGGSFDELKNLLVEIKASQGKLSKQMEKMMHTLDDILADVTDEGTKLDSLSALIAGLKQQIADALAGTTLPPAVQAKIDAVFAGVEANKAKVEAKIDAVFAGVEANKAKVQAALDANV